MNIDEHEYRRLKFDGEKLFQIIGYDLNDISGEYIRVDDENLFRRPVDFDEMCIALALLAKYMKKGGK